jgi:CRISPR-associated endonuclease/helicase Cas3
MVPVCAVAAIADPAAYFWNQAVPKAVRAVVAAGLAPAEAAAFGGVRRLFPTITRPAPAQQWAETVRLPEGPVLAVIEDLTGSGKTEAPLTFAHRLLAAGRAWGVYVALPTMATANAMCHTVVWSEKHTLCRIKDLLVVDKLRNCR